MKFRPFLTLPIILSLFLLSACAQKTANSGGANGVSTASLTSLPAVITSPSDYNELDALEAKVILNKGTEYAFTGTYHNAKEKGTYICKQCNQPLFTSDSKFDSGTGWPSFDAFIGESVSELTDADGYRTEIVCSNCDGHLGHVFRGEGFTEKQTRHCVNSVSLNFVPEQIAIKTKAAARSENDILPLDEYVEGKGYDQYGQATFAGGCFWCTEAAFEQIEGVVDVISGYSGGTREYPTYQQVGAGMTNHAEAIAIFYDKETIDYETLLKIFFVAHDPTQLNRQGPDVGRQYRSAIYYHGEEQKASAEGYIQKLGDSGKFSRKIVTELAPYTEFWVAEEYHQDYYPNHPENPYVQRISRPKVEKVRKEFKALLKKAYKQ